MDKLEVVTGHKANYLHQLELAREALDKVADAGDMATVKAIQAEIASLQTMVESCDRRIEKLQQELSEEGKQARRKANDAALAGYRAATKRLAPQARKIIAATAALVSELQAFHRDADQAGEHFRFLFRQIKNEHVRQGQGMVMNDVNFRGGALGLALSEELTRAGVFDTLAPLFGVTLPYHRDMPPMDEYIADRIEKAAPRVAHIHELVNADI